MKIFQFVKAIAVNHICLWSLRGRLGEELILQYQERKLEDGQQETKIHLVFNVKLHPVMGWDSKRKYRCSKNVWVIWFNLWGYLYLETFFLFGLVFLFEVTLNFEVVLLFLMSSILRSSSFLDCLHSWVLFSFLRSSSF